MGFSRFCYLLGHKTAVDVAYHSLRLRKAGSQLNLRGEMITDYKCITHTTKHLRLTGLHDL